ncbi:MAG: hypothetical protein U9N06_05890 [candidate division WOR-3 bacterium]|nr:hypothetical protein [candidate division WOR-3 bacterium]
MPIEDSFSKWVDKIARTIPGFSGYYRKEERRENDERLRVKISKKLEYIEEVLNERGRRVTKSKDLSLLDKIGRIEKKLEKLKDSIRYANYGYSGFFDQKEVSEGTLRSIYKADIELLGWIQDFELTSGVDTELDLITENIQKGFDLLLRRSEITEGD